MPNVLRYAGFGQEAEFGVPVAAAFHVDRESTTLDSPSDSENIFGGGIGRARRLHRPGYYAPSGNIVYAWDIRTIAHMLRWTLGGYVFSDGSPGLNTHEIYGANDAVLPSFTARIGKDTFEHVFAGCVVDSLELNLAGDFLLATMVVGARRDEKAALQEAEDLLLPEEFPLAFHEVNLELPTASDLSANVRALTLSIVNGLDTSAGRGIGSRYPYRLPVFERNISLGLDLYHEDEEQLEAFWGDSAGPSDAGAADFAAKITADAGADGSLVIDLPAAHFSQVNLQPSGRSELVQSTAVQALEDVVALADASEVRTEILATVENGEGDLAA